MEEIARQLRAEILALQDYITRVEDHFLATTWVGQLLPPFTQFEPQFAQGELQTILCTLQRVQEQFAVNGQLAPQLAELFKRYPELLAAASGQTPSEWNVPLLADQDGAEEAAAGEEEELAADSAPQGHGTALKAGESGAEVEVEEEAGELFAAAEPPSGMVEQEPAPDDVVKLFAAEEPLPSPGALSQEPASVAPGGRAARKQPMPRPDEEDSEDLSGLSLGLLTSAQMPRTSAPAATERAPERRLRRAAMPPTPLRLPASPPRRAPHPVADHLEAQIAVEDFPAHLHISLPPQDVPPLELKLHKKLNSRLMGALRERFPAGHWVLVPRVARLIHQGTLYPCTARVLAKIYQPLFGDLQDFARYRNCAFLNELPEPGWALIAPEALPETLGKNYLEQNQHLRHLADELGVIPRLVRRRSLVEALYDLIAACLVLGRRFQQQSLDWTTTGPTQTDFICLYSAAEGIRFKDLARTAHHPALGACPSL